MTGVEPRVAQLGVHDPASRGAQHMSSVISRDSGARSSTLEPERAATILQSRFRGHRVRQVARGASARLVADQEESDASRAHALPTEPSFESGDKSVLDLEVG